MKIKTITCHDVYNYGATLQAYALMKFLQDEGHQVEIIDYKPRYLSARYNLWEIGPRWGKRSWFIRIIYYAFKLPARLMDRLCSGKRAFDRFKDKHMCLTDRHYRNYAELKNDPPVAEAYIAGSDQIWNTSYENGRDPAFYLDFAPPGTTRISYAASFSIDEIIQDYRSFVKSMIEKLDHISVRERMGLDILKTINIDAGIHVLDPVFLLSRSSWNQLADQPISGEYLLVYDFEQNANIETFVKRIARERGLKIYAANSYQKTPYADADYYSSGPEVFLSLIKSAEIVVGNSFHALAFSLIFQKEFYVFGRATQSVNSRMQDLLSLCKLDRRMISGEMDYAKGVETICFEEVEKILTDSLQHSKDYLRTALTAG